MGLMRLRGVLLGLVGVLVLGLPGVALAGEGQGCPNEALRQELGSGFLPDCRAYEMVSPVYKEGVRFLPVSISSDGDRAFMVSDGAVAGIEGEGYGTAEDAVYMDKRTAGGWQLEPAMAPLNEFIGQLPVAFEANSGSSLWIQHLPSQSATAEELYVRSASGVYSLVGPLAKPANSAGEPSDVIEGGVDRIAPEPVASTDDYGHVVLRVSFPEAKWPFDHTSGEYSLYEYSGTGNSAPILAGVTGPKGSTSLVGECGTELGSGLGHSMYNALSGDGETIFFTPNPEGNCGSVDVWARRHGSLQASAPAETVDVSARASEPACTGGCRSSVESGKNFEGASENGERVFFTSTQQLLNGASQDPNGSDDAYRYGAGRPPSCAVTTGVGGCNLYEYDFNAPAGENLRLVAGGAEVLGVARIAEDGSRVYFVAKGELTKTANEFGAAPIAGEPNLYVYDTEEAERNPGYRPVFIATLSSKDGEVWQRTDQRPVWATTDGRFVVFTGSRPGLTPGDTSSGVQLFEYDAVTGELVRITQGENGYADNGNDAQFYGNFVGIYGHSVNDFHSSLNHGSLLAQDGMTVVFETQGRLSALASSAEHGCTSVYEYHSTGSIADGSVHLISDGLDTQITQLEGGLCGAAFLGMDANGENILFETDDPLLASDTDGVQRDLYDARVGGGFAVPPVPAGCQGEACLGAPGVSPTLVGARSGALSGGGNLLPVVSPVVVKPRAKSLTRPQKLARTLKECRGKPRRKRAVCEALARKRYAVVSKASGRGNR
jgi:hypothetical protein